MRRSIKLLEAVALSKLLNFSQAGSHSTSITSNLENILSCWNARFWSLSSIYAPEVTLTIPDDSSWLFEPNSKTFRQKHEHDILHHNEVFHPRNAPESMSRLPASSNSSFLLKTMEEACIEPKQRPMSSKVSGLDDSCACAIVYPFAVQGSTNTFSTVHRPTFFSIDHCNASLASTIVFHFHKGHEVHKCQQVSFTPLTLHKRIILRFIVTLSFYLLRLDS